MSKKALIFIFLVSFIIFSPCSAFPDEAGNREISNIEVRGLRTIEEDEFLYMMGLVPGVPLDEARITEGLKRSFRKGIFNSIEVSLDGSTLTLLASEKMVVDRIRMTSRIFGRRELLKELQLNRGTHATSDIIKERIVALEEYIRERGYHENAVHYNVNPLEPDNSMELDINIDEGPPTLIKNTTVFGPNPLKAKRVLRLNEGDVFDTIALEEGIRRLKEYYRDQGYISPEIAPPEFVEGKLVVRVREGSKLDYKIKALKGGRFLWVIPVRAVPDKEIIETMPFLDEGVVNDNLIAEGVDRAIDLYRAKGYSDVQIAPIVRTIHGGKEIKLYVNEGSKKKVRSFLISRNGKPVLERVKDILNNLEGSDYQPIKLEEDTRIIKEFYRALGYRDTSVSEAKFDIKGGFVDISVEVSTGNMYSIGNILVSGNSKVKETLINEKVKLKKGDPFNEADIAKYKRELQSACRTLGLYYCTVRASREFTPDGVNVKYEVSEGEMYYYGKTIVSGNRLIGFNTVRRHLKFKEGEPLDPDKLLQTKQRLTSLGVFSRVDTEIVWSGTNTADILIDVNESSPGNVDFGIGYGEYEGFRTFIGIGYRNLFGDADIGSIRLEASSLWRRYLLNYTEPYFLGRDLTSRTFFLREEREQKNIDTDETSYRVIKHTASTGLEKSLGKHVTASLFYEYSIVDTYDVKPGIILSKEDVGTVAISTLSPGIYYSTLDDPFDPSRGLLVGLTLKDAADYLLSDADFSKFTIKGNSYTRLGRDVVVAISLGGGLAETRGDTESIPLVERFYLGGRNSVRGFKQDLLGPRDSLGEPIGGSYFLLGNLEFRINLPGAWRTVIFGDCGNVWLDRDEVSTSDLRCSAGTGLRYNTPVGPLRLDYGWKMNRLDTETPGEFHFSIGHVF